MKQRAILVFTAVAAMGLQYTSLAADDTPKITDPKDRMSYSIGMNIGQNIKRGGVELNIETITEAVKDTLEGKELKLTDQQAQEAIMAYQQEVRSKMQEMRKTMIEKNRAEAEKFFAENKDKPGVKTHAVELPDGTKAELQYKVAKEGSGSTPQSNDVVSVNYRGTMLNGKEFGSSTASGKPAQFNLNQVPMVGWREALKLMKPGAKWEVYIPASLAYGDNGSGPNIEPGAALIMELELLSAETPPPPAPPQPLTSDIIKVPSAEELKKGAKIEVLKAEDVERQLRTNQAALKTNSPAK